MSACSTSFTTVASVEPLFSGCVSSVAVDTHAVFSSVPGVDAYRETVTMAESPGAIDPSWQTTVPLESKQDPRLELAYWNDAAPRDRGPGTTSARSYTRS